MILTINSYKTSKMKRHITTISLITSAGALLLSISNLMRADMIAERALLKREKELVQRMEPKASTFLEQMGVKPYENSPQTIDEFLQPLIQIIDNLDG